MMNPYEYNSINGDFLKIASNVIHLHKQEFAEFKENNYKFNFVKLLKELTGCGLKEAKDICDLYWIGKFPNIQEQRKDKLLRLEQLAKSPLVEELIPKIKALDDFQLRIFLMELTIDNLLSIDEKIGNKTE